MTGLVYQALPMGAVPIAHDSIIDLKEIEYEEVDMGDGTDCRFKASGSKDYPKLSQEDKDILDVVIQQFGKNWHNTNEHFTVEDFIRANCEYPGEWDGEISELWTIGSQCWTNTGVMTVLRRNGGRI